MIAISDDFLPTADDGNLLFVSHRAHADDLHGALLEKCLMYLMMGGYEICTPGGNESLGTLPRLLLTGGVTFVSSPYDFVSDAECEEFLRHCKEHNCVLTCGTGRIEEVSRRQKKKADTW